jgi:outer membrane protein assembly factor BamB
MEIAVGARMHSRTVVPLALLISLAGCASVAARDARAPSEEPPTVGTTETSSFQMAGPQSYTPEMKARSRTTLVSQLWTAQIGGTDPRTTMAFADGAVWVGARHAPGGAAGIYVVDGRSGARRALLPAAHGDVVGIALGPDRVYSSSSAGEVAVTSKAGVVLVRASVGAPIVTPPTLIGGGEPTLDMLVGDARGRVLRIAGRTGRTRWARAMSDVSEPRPSLGGGLALADLDGDGEPEIVGGTEGGKLFALRAGDGSTVWELTRPSALRAAPLLSDVDGDGKPEVIAGWADGDVAIIDGASGKELWSAHVEDDDGGPVGLLASPTPLPGGRLLVPTARFGKDDLTVLLGQNDRAYRTRLGAVTASPVVGNIQPETPVVAGVVGTTGGDIVGFDASGGVHFLSRIDGSIEAPGLIADLDGTGLRQVVVATTDGRLVAVGIHGTTPPVVARARGNASTNDGLLPAIDLGWRFRR